MDVPTPRPAGATGAAPAGRPLVVVGIDGSDGSRAALRYALAAAARRQAELAVIAARPPRRWAWESEDDPPGLTAELADLRERADAFWAEVRAGAPEAEDVPFHVLTVAGHPGDLLVEAAEQADLLVVGSRGRGAVRSALLGSVALHCVTDAPCPVAVVHPMGDRAGGPVLAAVDAAPSGRAVLAAALDEAARLGVRLDVLTAYQGDDSWTDVVATAGPNDDEVLAALRSRVDEVVAQVRQEAAPRLGDRLPEVRTEAVLDAPADALDERSGVAQVIVVGSSAHGPRRGLALGSVALHTVVRAACPVLVVHPAEVGAAAPEPAPA